VTSILLRLEQYRMRPCLQLLMVAALVSPALAQSRSCDLPRPSAVLYDHTVEIQRHGTCNLGNETLEDTLFGDARNAAVLLQGELDARQQYIQASLTDLRDLPFYLATDLRRAGGGELELTLCPRPPLPALVVRVEYGKRDAEGLQQIFAILETEPGQAMSQVSGLRGTLAITRQLETKKPVPSFMSLFDLEMATGPSGVKGLGLIYNESWEWGGVVQPADARFRALVRAAISEHVQCLRGRLERRGGVGGGRLALLLLALLKAGEDPEDPLIGAALARLTSEKLTATYDLSLAIMVIESLYTPPAERQLLLEGRLHAPMPREVSEVHRHLLQHWTSTLLGNVDSRVDPGYRWRWNYVPAARYDNSNTQLALLGLYAAHLCGIDVPRRVWEGAAGHWLDDSLASTAS